MRKTFLTVFGALIAFEVLYDLIAFIYTGIALGFNRAFLPWYSVAVLRFLGAM